MSDEFLLSRIKSLYIWFLKNKVKFKYLGIRENGLIYKEFVKMDPPPSNYIKCSAIGPQTYIDNLLERSINEEPYT